MERRSFITAMCALLASPLAFFRAKPAAAKPIAAISMLGFRTDVAKLWEETKSAGSTMTDRGSYQWHIRQLVAYNGDDAVMFSHIPEKCLRAVHGRSTHHRDSADYFWEICRVDDLKKDDFAVIDFGDVVMGGTCLADAPPRIVPAPGCYYGGVAITTLASPFKDWAAWGDDPNLVRLRYRQITASDAQLAQDTLRYAGELLYCGDPEIKAGNRPVGWTTLQHVPYATADAYLAQARGVAAIDRRRHIQIIDTGVGLAIGANLDKVAKLDFA